MSENATNAAQQAWLRRPESGTTGLVAYERLLDQIKGPHRGHHKPILILDGGLGTTLEDEYQIEFSSARTPTWSSHLLISSPETLLNAHEAFVEAGADVILTATYQASFEGFCSTRRYDDNATVNERGKFYSQEEARHFMRSAVPLARSAFCSRKGLVALSLGAYGATMIPSTEYTGGYPAEMGNSLALEQWHAQRMRLFEGDETTWREIDLVACETLPRVDEIGAVMGAMTGLSQQKPFWISCVFPNDDEKLPDGSEVTDVLRAMLGQASSEPARMSFQPVPMGIGINCTKVQKLRSLIGKFEDAAASMDLPLPHLVLYPDGANDSVYDTMTQKWIPFKNPSGVRQWDEEMFDVMQGVRERDKWAGIIAGGCCKTSPRNIARLRKRIDQEK
jgi:homocysteine S-methyltransferase